MGLETKCVAWLDGQVSEGKCQLETERLSFRGEFKVTIPFASIRHLNAAEGKLSVAFNAGTLILDLGPAATKWADKIRKPKSLLEKLGIKEGMKVSVQGMRDKEFLKQLKEKKVDVSKNLSKESDLIFLQADSKTKLAGVNSAAKSLASNGALWIVYPKGKEELKQDDIFKAGKSAGLVDVKVVSFSPTHTALKFVIPLSMRG
jgi:bifunctional DNA-binding transcriptional regulator/antitoxin component of YhaV-PrlF toxin-antitoxin module